MKQISVVVPVYNSESTLVSLHNRLTRVITALADSFGGDYEIIYVNDCSRDSSIIILQRLCTDDPRVTAVDLEKNAGQQNATLCGIRMASGSWVITIDDDLQYRPEDIPLLFDRLTSTGTDVMYGCPDKQGLPLFRRAGGVLRDVVFRLFLGKPSGLTVTSFKLMTGDIARQVAEDTTPYVYLSAAILKRTRNICNEPLPAAPSGSAPSNYTFRALAVTLIRIVFWYSPLSRFSRKRAGIEQYRIGSIYGTTR